MFEVFLSNMSLQPIDSKDDLTIPSVKYEYLDHTADVQLHSWGDNLQEAFEQCAISMFGYITDLETVTIDKCIDIDVSGSEDLKNLLYRFLDELLFLFCAEPFFIVKKVKILLMTSDFKITVRCYGEVFDLDKHPQGTEVKAITYSNMQIHETAGRTDIYVIIDI